MKDLYIVEIPTVLTELTGRGNVRSQLEEAAKSIFIDWAKKSLVEKIQVTKPRVKKNGAETPT